MDALPVLEPPSALSDDVCVNDLSDNLTEEEIAAAISQMQEERAPGLDKILTEISKFGGAEFVRCLKVIADGIWRTDMVPSDWMKQLLMPIHKNEGCTTCDNYCGIALLSIPSKIFSRAILNRPSLVQISYFMRISVASIKVEVVQISCSLCES